MSEMSRISHMRIDDDDTPNEYELLGEPEVMVEKGFHKIIIVDNLPPVTSDKYDKLLNVVKKIFSAFPIVDVHMPQENGKTHGFAFVEFETEAAAEKAITTVNNYKLDKNFTLRVNSFEDFGKFDKLSDEFVPVETTNYKPAEDLSSWLLDPNFRDQYVCRHDEHTEICWFNRSERKPETVLRKRNMTQTYIVWSPHGTYLGSFHKQGVILWGAASWSSIKKLEHPGVKIMDFSPRESYLVTFSPEALPIDNGSDSGPQKGGDSHFIAIWDIASGEIKRTFTVLKDDQNNVIWPSFQWSHDEKYFARLTPEGILIYETATMKVIKGGGIKTANIREFSWSPAENIISCWIPESGNIPAKIQLIEVPSIKTVRSHNLFQVTECKLHWQSKGEFLCAKVDRHGKNKKQTFTNFELYRMKEKSIPVDVLTVEDKIFAFAWEPSGPRFAIIHNTATATSGTKASVSIYTMGSNKPGEKFSKLVTLEKRPANLLFWSPAGRFIILAGFGAFGGALEFYDAQDLDTLRTEQHPMANQLEWDPTGRYVASVVSYWRHQSSLENGYTIWDFQGKELLHVSREKFYQLAWRVRPPTILTESKLGELRANLGAYSKKAKAADVKRLNELWQEKNKVRMQKRNEFLELREKRREEIKADREKLRSKLGGKLPEDNEGEWVEKVVEVEELISTEKVES